MNDQKTTATPIAPTKRTPSTMRRKAVAVRFFTYGAMAIATIVGIIICIAWSMGYRFDLWSGRVSQVALLQFNSFPAGALVTINGEQLAARTPTRSNVGTGRINLRISRQGYRDWSKTVTALPSSVRWLDYIRLVPQNIKTESVKTFQDVVDMIPSPDRKWVALVTDGTTGAMTLIDISSPDEVKYDDIQLDKSQITNGASGKYSLLEWDSASRFLLVEHKHDHKTEYLEYDRRDKTTRNLTRDFGMDLTFPHFSGTNGNTIFALTGGDLRKIDYGNKSISTPLANNVVSYVLHGSNRIAFLTKEVNDGKTNQAVSIYDDGSVRQIKKYDDGDKTAIAFSRNQDRDYLAIARGETVAIYPNPLQSGGHDPDESSTDIAYLSSPGGVDWMKMSDNGRFVLAGRDHKVVCYDVETTDNYSFEMDNTSAPEWLDNYHLLDVRDGTITMIEFDGKNEEHIVSGHLAAFLSADNKYLFSLDGIAGGVVLQRSNMTID